MRMGISGTGISWLFLPAFIALLCTVSCGSKKLPAPQGWYLNGEPLASTQNEVLPSGRTLHLPQKFTLEAASDSIVRLTQKPSGEMLVQLLVGTAMVQRLDPQFSAALLVNDSTIQLTGTRLLLQNQIGSTRVLLLDGSAVITHRQQKWELSAQADNLFEFKAGSRVAKKIPSREIDKLFPEVARSRLLLAVR